MTLDGYKNNLISNPNTTDPERSYSMFYRYAILIIINALNDINNQKLLAFVRSTFTFVYLGQSITPIEPIKQFFIDNKYFGLDLLSMIYKLNVIENINKILIDALKFVNDDVNTKPARNIPLSS